MDPDVTLQQLRGAIETFRAACEDGEGDSEHDAACDIADHAEALDQWLCQRGVRPKDWAWAPFPSDRESRS